MLTSSCATVLYLRRHMKNMKESSRSSPHLHSQMRVTITGIIQTLLYFLCSVWLVICDSAFELTNSYFDADRYVLCTVITLYSFGTNINLGVGHDICYAVIIECICFAMRTSVTSILWLNVFYYCQIVPAQHPPFIWMKKNIRVFIYSALIMDKFFFMFEFSLVSDVLYADTWIRLAYFLLCLFVMSASSCATVLYLQRHMKSMEESSRSFSSPRLQKQMRVTITGSIQALLYFLCSTWLLVRELLVFVFYLEIDLNGHLFCTVACLYSLGITINLSVGQTVFRQQVIHVLQICLQTLKLGSI
uniref:Taste receptor type 2 n=1 Tax=Pygocentrus nattereri TaxID=42514 RepID=A0AAR2L9I8_PYGNA